MNSYTITVQNDSQDFKNYALFTEKPEVTGNFNGQLWTNVFAIAQAPPGAPAVFTIYKQYRAIATTSHGSPDSGVVVNVGTVKDVTLGSKATNGVVTKGATVGYDVNVSSFGKTPYFKDGGAPMGFENAFAIKTMGTFDKGDVVNGNWLIGVGGSVGGVGGPAALFAPQPNSTYQIKPINKFYVTFGDFSQNTLIAVDQLANEVALCDFSKDGSPNAILVINNKNNNMTPQVPPTN